MKIVIGALGYPLNPNRPELNDRDHKAGYLAASYQFGSDEAIPAYFCLKAVTEKVGPDQTIVLITEKAEVGWRELEPELRQIPGVCPVKIGIPDGKNPDELWQIFQLITEHVPAQSTVYVDMTNGFRSLPFFLIMAVSYLRQIKEVTIADIFYGAFEAAENGITPVFSLLPFLTLMDWSIGVSTFNRTGDVSLLAMLLREATHEPDEAANLVGLVNALDDVSLALDFARPDEAMKAANRVVTELHEAETAITRFARPLHLLATQLEQAFQSIALSGTNIPVKERLQRQLQIIHWYSDRGRRALAGLLAREWFASALMLKRGKTKIDDLKEREKFTDLAQHLEDLPKFSKIWTGRLQMFRNHIAHMGQIKGAVSATDLRDGLVEVIDELPSLLD